MPSARSSAARAHSRSDERRGPHRARPRALAGEGRAIRWDRVGRVALLIVAFGVLALYVGPAISMIETLQERGQRQQQLDEFERRHDRLVRRRDALRDPHTLEREARRLGKVRPGERPYVVDGLPGG